MRFQGCFDLETEVQDFHISFWRCKQRKKHRHSSISKSGWPVSLVTINEFPNLSAHQRFDFAVIFEPGSKVKEQINAEVCIWLSSRVIWAQSCPKGGSVLAALQTLSMTNRKGDAMSKGSPTAVAMPGTLGERQSKACFFVFSCILKLWLADAFAWFHGAHWQRCRTASPIVIITSNTILYSLLAFTVKQSFILPGFTLKP